MPARYAHSYSSRGVEDDDVEERVVPFRSRGQAVPRLRPVRGDDKADVTEAPSRPRRIRERPRLSSAQYAMTAVALIFAVLVVGWLLVQLGQIGRKLETTPPGASAATTVAAVRPSSQETSPPAAAPAPVPPANPAPVPTVGSRPGEGPLRSTLRALEPTYTVASGETLGSIARKFNTSVEALQGINNLPDRNVLSVGQKLVIPTQE